MTIPQRLAALRYGMAHEGLDAYLVTTADPHGSEYVAPFDQARAYFSGFTGSAGNLLVLGEEALLWTDSRYFLQAERELDGSGITLMREGEPGTPSLGAYIRERLGGKRLGMDGRCVSLREADEYRGPSLVDADLITAAWPDRPALSKAPAFALGMDVAGRSAQDKLAALRAHMVQRGARSALVTDLLDGAWLFNLRGGDIPCTPVARFYALVEAQACFLFMAEETAAPVAEYLGGLGAQVLPYGEIVPVLARYGAGDTLLVSPGILSLALGRPLRGQGTLVEESDYLVMSRCVKNQTELARIREAHVQDGAVLTRFLRYVKENASALDEMRAKERLDGMRLEAGCVDTAFGTICGFGPHAAIVHYQVNEETCLPLEEKGLMLLDSGGQWMGATTDVTRTVVLGPLTQEEKRDYTLVLKGMLALMNARFPSGVDGAQLDILARQPIWQAGMDYGHGTGHGVGAMLSVHEPPVRIRYNMPCAPFQPGMVVSDEPGLYRTGSHGVRLENLLECVELPNGMLAFEPLTLAPFELGAIDPGLMEPEDVRRLNAYHARVLKALSPLLCGEDLKFLEQAARPL